MKKVSPEEQNTPSFKSTSSQEKAKKKKKSGGIFSFCCKPDKEDSYQTPTKTGPTSFRPTSTMNVTRASYNTTESVSEFPRLSIGKKNVAKDKAVAKLIKTIVSYPENEVFILGTRSKIVAKITTITVSKTTTPNLSFADSPDNPFKGYNQTSSPVKWSEKLKEQIQYKKEIFLLAEKGIKADKWEEITPEPIAKHIAQRLRCNIMIDALCGFGGNTIQFAKFSNFVIAIDIEPSKTFYAKHNAAIYNVSEGIDFWTADFLKIRNLSGDIVFLNPGEVPRNPGEQFSISKHLTPNLSTLLGKSLELSHQICIKLPKETDFQEMASFFNQSLEYFELYSKRFCIEIEKIYNSQNELECIVVYFGDCSTIDVNKEYEAIYNYVAKEESLQWKQETTYSFFCRIIEKVGIRKSLKYLAEIENTPAKPTDPPFFQRFLKALVKENIFTDDSITKIKEIESKRRNNNFTMGPLPQQTNPIASGNHSPSSLKGHSPVFGQSPNFAGFTEMNKEKNSSGSFSPRNMSLGNNSSGGKKDKFMSKNNTPFDTVFNRGTFNENTLKNSYEVSELALSSYSVSSDYLNEIDSDEAAEKTKTHSRTISDDGLPGRNRVASDYKITVVNQEREKDLNSLADELPDVQMKKKSRKSMYQNRNNKFSMDVRKQHKHLFRSVNPNQPKDDPFDTGDVQQRSFKMHYEEVDF